MYNNKELFILMNMYRLFYNIKFLKIYKGGGQYRVSSIGYIVKKGKEIQGKIQKMQDTFSI